MTVEQATEALRQARSEHARLLQEARETPTKIVRLPAIGSGSFTEERAMHDPQVLEASSLAVRDAEKVLRLAQRVRHNRLAIEILPEVSEVDERIADLWPRLHEAYEERADLQADFSRRCRCNRDGHHAHRLGDAPPPLTYRQVNYPEGS